MSVYENGYSSASASPVKTDPADNSSILQEVPEFEALQAQLAKNPHDPPSWRRLVQLAQDSGETLKIRAAFDALLQQYPNADTAQISYINHFLTRPETFTDAEELFRRFLRTSPCVEFWRFYLTYVRRVNSTPQSREAVKQSYEFAIMHIGQDKDSGDIWSDYLRFLEAGPANTTWEQQQKMDSLRKVYHRAVQIPLENVQRLWEELETFENSLNKITAKKFMADLSPSFMQARQVLRELKAHYAGLYPSGGPDMYLPDLPTFNLEERALVGKWKAYLKWEESNPLLLEDKDRGTFITRVQGVYRKALIRMRYFSEIWFMAYTWTASVGKHDEAVNILKQGLEANPTSFVLTFAYAEVLETKGKLEEVHQVYDRLISLLRKELEELEVAMTLRPEADPISESFSSQGSSSSDLDKDFADKKQKFGLVWIMYMRFGRRAEGTPGARKIFKSARFDKYCTWEVFEAAALTEYHHTAQDKSIPSKIFEKGMDLFAGEIDYVLRYLGYLISLNDENNARALFERVIGTFPADKARPLWERWARYEYQQGDLQAALKLEKRMAEAYPNDPPIKRFAQRHMYLGMDAIADRDLGFSKVNRSLASDSSGSSIPGMTSTPPAPAQSSSQPKRHASPPNDRGPSYKRQRNMSPPPPPPSARDRDRDRPPPRRRSPPPPRRDRDRDYSRDEERKHIQFPPVLSDFLAALPPKEVFDGPVFRTDDLLNLFRNAVIPSSATRARSPPPPPPYRGGGGRRSPDYGPNPRGRGGARRGY